MTVREDCATLASWLATGEAQMTQDWHWRVAAAADMANEPGRLSALLLRHGSMSLRWYEPPAPDDPQTPHSQDELYVVARGSGTFVRGDKRVAVEPGDVLFVPAGVAHRFVAFSEDFATWVVFYGPEGGEQDVAEPTAGAAE